MGVIDDYESIDDLEGKIILAAKSDDDSFSSAAQQDNKKQIADLLRVKDKLISQLQNRLKALARDDKRHVSDDLLSDQHDVANENRVSEDVKSDSTEFDWLCGEDLCPKIFLLKKEESQLNEQTAPILTDRIVGNVGKQSCKMNTNKDDTKPRTTFISETNGSVLTKNDRIRQLLLIENHKLIREMNELKEYYEMADVEAEEKISLLANKIEELEEMLETKSRECLVLNTELNEKTSACKQVEGRAQNLSVQLCRQQDLNENLRDEMEKLNNKCKDLCKEKSDLLTMNASLNHELNFYKRKSRNEQEKFLEQLNLAGKELHSCIDNLKQLECRVPVVQPPTTKDFSTTVPALLTSNNSNSVSDSSVSSSVATLASKLDALERDITSSNSSSSRKRAFLQGHQDDRVNNARACLLRKYSLSNDRF